MADRHDHECEHGCEHDHDMEMTDVVTLVDEDGKEYQFDLLLTLEVDGVRYAVLAEEEDEEAFILRFEGEEDSPDQTLVNIEDEEEYEKVAAAYEEFMMAEFDEDDEEFEEE